MIDGLKSALIVVNRKRDNIKLILDELTGELDARAVNYVIVNPEYFTLNNREVLTDFDDRYRHREYDIIFAIGGDGTFLYTARTYGIFGIPIVGINAGRLGFLMECLPEQIPEVLDLLDDGNYQFKSRVLMDVQAFREGRLLAHFSSFNDTVISRGALSRMIELEVSVVDKLDEDLEVYARGNLFSRFRADGIVVSTPTGSTAYNLSAGGPILMQDTRVFSVTPISPHTMTSRPVVVNCEHYLVFRVVSGDDNTNLTVDGQENIALCRDDTVIIRESDQSIRMLYLGDKNFFITLREKLGWHV